MDCPGASWSVQAGLRAAHAGQRPCNVAGSPGNSSAEQGSWSAAPPGSGRHAAHVHNHCTVGSVPSRGRGPAGPGGAQGVLPHACCAVGSVHSRGVCAGPRGAGRGRWGPRGMSCRMPAALWAACTAGPRAQGPGEWEGRYYTYAVRVFSHWSSAIEDFEVTDPYSLSLAADGARTQAGPRSHRFTQVDQIPACLSWSCMSRIGLGTPACRLSLAADGARTLAGPRSHRPTQVDQIPACLCWSCMSRIGLGTAACSLSLAAGGARTQAGPICPTCWAPLRCIRAHKAGLPAVAWIRTRLCACQTGCCTSVAACWHTQPEPGSGWGARRRAPSMRFPAFCWERAAPTPVGVWAPV